MFCIIEKQWRFGENGLDNFCTVISSDNSLSFFSQLQYFRLLSSSALSECSILKPFNVNRFSETRPEFIFKFKWKLEKWRKWSEYFLYSDSFSIFFSLLTYYTVLGCSIPRLCPTVLFLNRPIGTSFRKHPQWKSRCLMFYSWCLCWSFVPTAYWQKKTTFLLPLSRKAS